MLDTCPLCAANLQGEPIPQEAIDKGWYGADSTHFSRKIGVEIRGIYDGILYWQCPDCGGRWHRWPEGSWQWEKTVKLWASWDIDPADQPER